MLTLEERAVPAAFSVSHEGIGAGIPVTASALFLTGGGDLTIDSPAPGVFDVTSTGGITDVSKKGPGTAITNGFEFIGVANIVIDATKSPGNNTVTFGRGNLVQLVYRGGLADDKLEITSLTANPVNHTIGTVSFSGGIGNNTFSMHDGVNRVVSGLTITNGDGNNTTQLGIEGNDQTILGSLAITNGNGQANTTVAGVSLNVLSSVKITDGTSASKAANKGSNVLFNTAQNLTIGGTTTIKNFNAVDPQSNAVQFGAGGQVNLGSVGVTNGKGSANLTFGGLDTTIAGSLTETCDKNDCFNTVSVNGDNFTVMKALTITSCVNAVTLAPTSTLHVVGETKITGSQPDGSVAIGTGGTTNVFLGKVTVLNGGSVTLNGHDHTVGGLGVTHSALTVNGNQTSIYDIFGVNDGDPNDAKANRAVTIGGNSFTVSGKTAILGADVHFNSAKETVLRDILAIANKNTTFAGGLVNLKSATIASDSSVVVNSPMAVNGDAKITSAGGFVGSAKTLDVLGKLNIIGACVVNLTGAQTNVSGDVNIQTAPSTASIVNIEHTRDGGKTSVSMVHGAGDTLNIDASDFLGPVNVTMDGGNQTVRIAQKNDGQATTFADKLTVNMFGGTVGNEKVLIGSTGLNKAEFGDAVDIFFRGGNDTFSVDNSDFLGAVKVTMDGSKVGNEHLNVAQSLTGQPTIFLSKVTVDMRGGTSTALIGRPNDANNYAILADPKAADLSITANGSGNTLAVLPAGLPAPLSFGTRSNLIAALADPLAQSFVTKLVSMWQTIQ